MRTSSAPSNLILVLLSSAVLTACGGGGGAGSAQTSSPAPLAAPPAPAPTPAPVPSPASTAAVAAPVAAVFTTSGIPQDEQPVGEEADAPAPAQASVVMVSPPLTLQTAEGSAVTDVRFQNTSAVAQSDVPVTFGHAFAVGHVSSAQSIVGKLADGSTVPLQVDVKARHPDGSLRHAIVSARLPSLAASATATMSLHNTSAAATVSPTGPQQLLDGGFKAAVHIDLAGVRYTASADSLLRTGRYNTWLSGNVANEWHVSAPLTTAQGTAHPHLTARFAIRNYAGTERARVDVTVENNWAYEAAPQNFSYDAHVQVGDQTVYTKLALTHYHHARWRKVFWHGATPQVHVKHNSAYLIGTKAVPNYDQSLVFTETKLNSYKTAWSGTKVEPMGIGIVNPNMPATGGRDELGILPAWSAMYVLSMDKRLKDVMLGTGDLAGSWSAHYRNKTTDRPISLMEFPYMTIQGNPTDTVNPVTKLKEAFPVCATTTACTTPYKHDTAHQASFAYLPYLVTGDYYYLEEMQFWAMYNAFVSNPGYRQNIKGLMYRQQVRGQAWAMRTLADAAFITPDADPLKSHFSYFLDNNLEWYNANYTNNAAATTLGVLTHNGAVVYDNSTSVAPWQDDFFTAAIGHTAELGYTKANPLLAWKARFPLSRMTGADTCWITGAIYSLKIRDSETAPFYATIGQAWKASHTPEFAALSCGGTQMAASLSLKVGEMTGYSSSTTGYPSNMQPALAYAADAMGTAGRTAWNVFANRAVKPNYGNGPQFAILPRN